MNRATDKIGRERDIMNFGRRISQAVRARQHPRVFAIAAGNEESFGQRIKKEVAKKSSQKQHEKLAERNRARDRSIKQRKHTKSDWRVMYRASAPSVHVTPAPPPAPQHTGSPLTVGEKCLLRRPHDYFDVVVELRAIDRDVAVVHFSGLDRSEVVPLTSLRRAEIMRWSASCKRALRAAMPWNDAIKRGAQNDKPDNPCISIRKQSFHSLLKAAPLVSFVNVRILCHRTSAKKNGGDYD
jgi:hypothetical protein